MARWPISPLVLARAAGRDFYHTSSKETTGHSVERCWQLHPELRPSGARGLKSRIPKPRPRGAPVRGRSHGRSSSSVVNFMEVGSSIGSASGDSLASPTPIENKNELCALTHPSTGMSSPGHINPRSLIIDSGCSRHVMGDAYSDLVISRTRIDPISLRLPDGREYQATEMVSARVCIRTHRHNSKEIVVNNIVFIPVVSQFLISVKQLCLNGHEVLFSRDKCVWTIAPSETIEFHTSPNDTLYRIEIVGDDVQSSNTDSAIANVSIGHEDSKDVRLGIRWHQSLGHLGSNIMNKLVSRGLIPRIPSRIVDTVCNSCAHCKLMKAKANPVPKEATSPLPGIMKAIHCDEVTGLPSTPSGYTGFSLIVDRRSKFIDIKLIKGKDESAGHIKEFISKMTTYGHHITSVRTDSAAMYAKSADFINWLKSRNIRQELSAPHSQYQNGVAERHIQTLKGMASAALDSSQMPLAYWGEAMLWAKFTWNAIPRGENNWRSPYSLVTGAKFDMSFLHPFGCKAYVRLPSDQQKSFVNNAIEAEFLNCDDRSKAFRIRPIGKIERGRLTVLVRSQHDVKFDDFCFPRRERRSVSRKPDQEANLDPPIVPNCTPNVSDTHRATGDTSNDVPTTPPLIVRDDLMTSPSDFSLVPRSSSSSSSDTDVSQYFPSRFVKDVTLHPRSGLRSGKPFSADVFEINFLDDAAPELWAFHADVGADSVDGVPVDQLITEHVTAEEFAELPNSIDEARASPIFSQAADDEMSTIKKFGTYDLVPRSSIPSDVRTYKPLWRFRIKADGRAKARLCFPGHRQLFGVNYDVVESPTLHLTSFRIFLAYAAFRNAKVMHVDIKNAYLHATVDEEIYMEQPPGYIDEEHPDYVCRMNRALYGMKQAGRLWNKLAHAILTAYGFSQNDYDPCVYLNSVDSANWAVVLVFVDDFLVIGSPHETDRVIEYIGKRLVISSNSEVSRYVGIDVRRDENGGFALSQAPTILSCIKEFGMSGAKPCSSPSDPSVICSECVSDPPIDQSRYRSLVGTLLYIAMCTRPDILSSVIVCAQFQRSPNTRAWLAIKRIIRYLIGTVRKELIIRPSSLDLSVYSDASHGDPALGRFAMSGSAVFLGGSLVHWSSRKQKSPAHSSAEAELIAASSSARDAVWITRLIAPVGGVFPIKLFVDNQSALLMANSDGMLRRVKHLEIQDMYVRTLRRHGLVVLEFVPGSDNVADILTKAMKATSRFVLLRDLIMAGLRGSVKIQSSRVNPLPPCSGMFINLEN